MASTFAEWSKERLDRIMKKWEKVEYYFSEMGMVCKESNGEWTGKIRLASGAIGRLSESYVSADAAMGAVERTWKREEERRNGCLKPR